MSIDVKLLQEFERLHKQLRTFGSPDFYQGLGVPQCADEKQMQAKYWEKAKKYHPDTQNPNKPEDAEERLVVINRIYEILSDPAKRASYDEWLELLGSQQARQPPAGNQGNGNKASPGSRGNPQAANLDFEASRMAWRDLLSENSWRTFGVSPDFETWKEETKRVMEAQLRLNFGDSQQFHIIWNAFVQEINDPDLAKAWNIFNMGSWSGDSKRSPRQPDNYAGVKRVKMEVGFDGLELGFSVDGKVYVEARNSLNQSQYNPATGELSIGSLEGRLLLPKNSRGLRVEIDGRHGGSITGKIAHPGEIRTPSSSLNKVDIGLCEPLEIVVEKEGHPSGKIDIRGMVNKGDGRYVPRRPEVPTGTLRIRASGMGNVTVHYESMVAEKWWLA